jgi:ABC-type antimicrobial peptide transport system permease subunit
MSYSMGLLILFLAAMVIFFAFLYLILRREREIGLYRFFGATRLKVTLLLTGEAFVMAFICALAGLILSVVLLETAITWIMNSVAQTYFKDVFQLISSATPANETTPFQINALFQFPWYEAWSFAGIVILAGTLAAFIPTLIASYSNMLDRIRK